MSINKIKKCACGANKFKVEVNVKYHALITPDGRLCIDNPEPSEFKTFTCLNCGKEYGLDSVWSVNLFKYEEKLSDHAQERKEERNVPSWVMEYMISFCDIKTVRDDKGFRREIIQLRSEDIKIAPRELKESLRPYIGTKVVRLKDTGKILTIIRDESPIVR